MSKYGPLWDHVRENQPAVLTFQEIQEICGFPIDHSFLQFKKELTEFGYQVGKISMKKETVTFIRIEK